VFISNHTLTKPENVLMICSAPVLNAYSRAKRLMHLRFVIWTQLVVQSHFIHTATNIQLAAVMSDNSRA
jgi:hypothetical protein